MEMVKNRQEKVKNREVDGFGKDYLGLLLKAYHDEGHSMKISADQLVDECKTLYVAGQETTNTLLSWMMGMIINETLRLYSPVFAGFMRVVDKPDRFSEGVAKATNNNPSAFMPFGMGPHTCAGFNFATNEAKITIAMILQRFTFSLSPGYVHSPFPVLAVRPEKGVQVIINAL
ncbi:unnamed protein product [Linum tenue]|uniref:Cytochrome P450 n=1 Tax=Linum tenue TaxID=586396 RepID=A0AAV0NZ16_9ROSI|nr:unnamed protein product [Linum tenue]